MINRVTYVLHVVRVASDTPNLVRFTYTLLMFQASDLTDIVRGWWAHPVYYEEGGYDMADLVKFDQSTNYASIRAEGRR